MMFNVFCVYCWQLEWINQDIVSFSLECNLMLILAARFSDEFIVQ